MSWQAYPETDTNAGQPQGGLPRSAGRLSPLFRMALLNGMQSAVEMHLAKGEPVDALADRGRTPLMLAAGRGHAAICQLLLDAGANARLTDLAGQDALSLAKEAGHMEVVSLLHAFLEPASVLPPESIQIGAEISAEAAEDIQDEDESGLGEWIPEEELPPPENDPSCTVDARAAQQRISEHELIDTDEDWSDIEIDLPDVDTIKSWRKKIDRELEDRLRLTFAEALREGRLPLARLTGMRVEEEDPRKNAEPDDLPELLQRLLEDFGIIVVDDPADEACAPFADQAAAFDAESWTDEAVETLLDALRQMVASINDPVDLHLMEIRRHPRLSYEESLSLFRQLRNGSTDVLNIFSESISALDVLFSAAAAFRLGSCSLSKLVLRDQARDDTAQADDVVNDDDEPPGPQVTEGERFLSAIEDIRMMAGKGTTSAVIEISAALRSLTMTPWLIEKMTNAIEPHLQPQIDQSIRSAKKIQERLVLANLRLSVWEAQRSGGLTYGDRIQVAHIGLMKTVDRYDPDREVQFGTYAHWWMRQSVSREVADTAHLIRLPVHSQELQRKMNRKRAAILAETGQAPNAGELAQALEKPETAISRLLAVEGEILSLEIPNEDGETLAETLADDVQPNAFDLISAAELRAQVQKMLALLSPREAAVIRMRFGIDQGGNHERTEREHTLEEIGQLYGVTRERIRQIEVKALSKLGHPSRKKRWAEFK